MGDIILKDGHLYKDGEKLKLEFGNQEQLKAKHRIESAIAKFKDGLQPETSYKVEAAAYFTCICSHRVFTQHFPVDDEGDIDCFEDITAKCSNCKKEYKFIVERTYKTRNGRRYADYEKLLVKFK